MSDIAYALICNQAERPNYARIERAGAFVTDFYLPDGTHTIEVNRSTGTVDYNPSVFSTGAAARWRLLFRVVVSSGKIVQYDDFQPLGDVDGFTLDPATKTEDLEMEIRDLNEEVDRWSFKVEDLEKQRDELISAFRDLSFYAAPHMYENGQGEALEELSAIVSRIEKQRDA